MKLIIFNGSPRGRNSNTKLLMDQFIKGMYDSDVYNVEMYYLASKSDKEEAVEVYKQADNILLALPLYTDSMPGLVKEFIEMLEPFAGQDNNPNMGFFIQSGFPEPAHSRFLEKYLERLTRRMNTKYLGTIVKGGVEGIRIMPPMMTHKLFKRFFKLGKSFAISGEFDEKIVQKLAKREQMSLFRLFFFRMMQKTKMPNFYWDSQLRENGVFDIRFDRPYILNKY